MPSIATHPQAKFDPIPPDLDLEALVDRTPNFEWVQRIPANKIRKLEFEKLVWYQVVKQGKPLVIEGWNSKLPKSLFGTQFLESTYNKKRRSAAVFRRVAVLLTAAQRRKFATLIHTLIFL